MKKEKSDLIQEALDTLQAVTLSGRSTESFVAELFENIRNLEEENKKLKSDLAYERTMLDNVRAEYKSLQNVIKKLKDIQGEVKPTQKSKTITVTDEDNRIILEKGEDGKRHSYGGGNVVLC